eukprot:3417915-Prymnesium_polylepis.2
MRRGGRSAASRSRLRRLSASILWWPSSMKYPLCECMSALISYSSAVGRASCSAASRKRATYVATVASLSASGACGDTSAAKAVSHAATETLAEHRPILERALCPLRHRVARGLVGQHATRQHQEHVVFVWCAAITFFPYGALTAVWTRQLRPSCGVLAVGQQLSDERDSRGIQQLARVSCGAQKATKLVGHLARRLLWRVMAARATLKRARLEGHLEGVLEDLVVAAASRAAHAKCTAPKHHNLARDVQDRRAGGRSTQRTAQTGRTGARRRRCSGRHRRYRVASCTRERRAAARTTWTSPGKATATARHDRGDPSDRAAGARSRGLWST